MPSTRDIINKYRVVQKKLPNFNALSFCKLLSKDIRARSSTPAGTDVDAEVLSFISACQTYVGDDGLAFWNSTSAYPSLAPLAQDLLAAPASQAYVERVFSIDREFVTSAKKIREF